jgi:hypothetical protein
MSAQDGWNLDGAGQCEALSSGFDGRVLRNREKQQAVSACAIPTEI